jgi:hypothetical protein
MGRKAIRHNPRHLLSQQTRLFFFFSPSAPPAAAAMEMNTEAEQLSNGAVSQDHKRAENVHEIGGEVKRPREGRDDKDGGHLDCMDEDDEVFMWWPQRLAVAATR